MTQETTWQDRVRAEARELSEKLAKLHAFQASEAFGQLPYYERDLLIAQRGHMANYLSVLQARIGLFPVPQDTGDQAPVNPPVLVSGGELTLKGAPDGTVIGVGTAEMGVEGA